ncbi:nucleoside hydrolase [Paenibacillus dendritiformis]|uniref:Ribosylpyrimidine nucleosidase n=1 Tax=Paenibacillus dendritiformis C454 TaxID=1131935 RepID=H3SNV5_9BACL|nr:nucleoside hydrolase [Paenibacillus dendritiformis]EHQ59248.1 ribosylpyrimidine nucleosidase [Paenibacillus dendritiformis C454]CAH8771983.1 nucleoside hydrolase [Paenibacillus dendritiformis]
MAEGMKKKIILDCDPGHDDAIAIMLAAKYPIFDLLAITIVAGNQTLEKTARNAVHICSYLDIRDVPIAAGMAEPMIRKQVIADAIHGETGMDGPSFGEPTLELDTRHAVDLIIELLMNSEGDITLVPTGPLTNIGMAIRREPRIVPKIKEIILMGGAYQLGNVTPAAEFNIYADPDAAHVVVTCGRPIVMIGLDLTRQALVVKSMMDRIASLNNKASKLFIEIMSWVGGRQKEIYGWEGPPLHDPTTLIYLMDPSIIQTKPMHVAVELRSEACYGRTLCDYFGITGEKPNAEVAVKLDFAKFEDAVYETLKLYS